MGRVIGNLVVAVVLAALTVIVSVAAGRLFWVLERPQPAAVQHER